MSLIFVINNSKQKAKKHAWNMFYSQSKFNAKNKNNATVSEEPILEF